MLSHTSWPLAARQALDAVGDCSPESGLAAALKRHLLRLQEEEPAEQREARATWAAMQALLMKQSSTPTPDAAEQANPPAAAEAAEDASQAELQA